MILHERRQPRERSGRARTVILVILAGLVLVVGIFAAYQRFKRNRIVQNEALVNELKEATIVEDTADAPTVGDWPQWRGPQRDGVSREKALLAEWPQGGPKKLWEAETGFGYSAVAVAADRAITMVQDGDKEAVVCWDANTGKEQWCYRYPASYVNGQGSGPRSTPTIHGDYVYTVGGTGILHCLTLATGKKVWSHDLLTEFHASNLMWGVSFSPLIEGDLVLTNPGGRNGNSIVAFDKRSGDVAWKAGDDMAGYSSPIAVTAAGERQVLFFTAAGLVGLSPEDGKVLWRFAWENGTKVSAATPIVFRATVADETFDYVFVSSNYGKGAVLLKLLPAGAGAVKAERVYETKQMQNHFSSSVRLGKHVYGFNDSLLACVDVTTGQAAWQERGFNKGSLTIADGRLIILGERGKLALAEADPNKYHELASFAFSHNQCWTVPVVANGKMYVRDQQKLVCYDLRSR
jgi:outer membrane protein assembly factor BamB